MHVMLIRVDAASVVNINLHYYLTPEVASEVPVIGSTDLKIPIENICSDDELDFRSPGGRGKDEDERDKSDECDAIPTGSRQCQAVTDPERCHQGWSDVDVYDSGDGDDRDADDGEESSQSDEGSMPNVED